MIDITLRLYTLLYALCDFKKVCLEFQEENIDNFADCKLSGVPLQCSDKIGTGTVSIHIHRRRLLYFLSS